MCNSIETLTSLKNITLDLTKYPTHIFNLLSWKLWKNNKYGAASNNSSFGEAYLIERNYSAFFWVNSQSFLILSWPIGVLSLTQNLKRWGMIGRCFYLWERSTSHFNSEKHYSYLFLTYYHRCNELNDKALQELTKMFNKFDYLETVSVRFFK